MVVKKPIFYAKARKSLILSLISGNGAFKRLYREFPKNPELLMEKGVYCYDYTSNYSVFSQTVFPPKNVFYNQLKDEDIKDSDYERALNIYRQFNCETFLDYMLIYVKTDTGNYKFKKTISK